MPKPGGKERGCLGSCRSPGISGGSTFTQGALGGILHAVLDAPVHDVANEGAGEKTQQLHDSKDGGVELNWARTEEGVRTPAAQLPTPSGGGRGLNSLPLTPKECDMGHLPTCLFHLLSLLVLLCGERKDVVKES